MEAKKKMTQTHESQKRLAKYAIPALALSLFAAWLALTLVPQSLFAQVIGGSTQTLANPLKVQQFFDSAAFFLIKTVGSIIGIIAIAISVFAAKFGRGSFSNIASVCFYIGLLFLAPSIVQLLSIFAGIGF